MAFPKVQQTIDKGCGAGLAPSGHEEAACHPHFAPCQIVAWKLEKIRTLRRLSQDEAALLLEPYLGRRMSRAAFSQAERCLDKGRIRRFDADEIVAFARAFEVAKPYFFSPAEPHRHGKRVIVNGKPGDRAARISSPSLSVPQMTMLAQGRPLDATHVRIAEVAAASAERAISNGVYSYLKENPDRLAELSLLKLPKELEDRLKEENEINRTAHSEPCSQKGPARHSASRLQKKSSEQGRGGTSRC